MHGDENAGRGHDEPVRLVAYDQRWPAMFEREAVAITAAIGPWITGGIHHVGSTSVPGLAAKPVIDIAVGVADLPASGCRADRRRVRLAGLGAAPVASREQGQAWVNASVTAVAAATTAAR
jgi:GrpB-like predicted nucleotidyltransferase (UPF0157 family)